MIDEMTTIKKLRESHNEYKHCGGSLNFISWLASIGIKPEDITEEEGESKHE